MMTNRAGNSLSGGVIMGDCYVYVYKDEGGLPLLDALQERLK